MERDTNKNRDVFRDIITIGGHAPTELPLGAY
jgi:hypothetical protein